MVWTEAKEKVAARIGYLAGFFPYSRASKNVIWNLIGGVWGGVLVVLTTPIYVSRIGLEGFGLLSLWLMMQVMMGLLDLGMGATLIREFANLADPVHGGGTRRDFLRTLEFVYWPLAACLTLVVFLSAGWLSAHWLTYSSMSKEYVENSIKVMALTLGFQFPCVLYSNGLAGLQSHGRVNALQIFGNSMRYGIGVALLIWRSDLVLFFSVQVVVGTIQTFLTKRMLWRMIPQTVALPARFRLDIIQRFWRFSLGMALTACSGVLLGNIDRILLSKMGSAKDLGKYSIALAATGLLQVGIQPFYKAFFPRYSELISSGDSVRLREEYFKSCKFMALIVIAVATTGWVFAPQLFKAWIDRCDKTIIDVFRWLLIGITGAGLMWLPAAFQQAHGWTRLHAAMMIGALALGIPVAIGAIRGFGTVGATLVWVIHGVSEITLGLWLMHRRLLKGELVDWYRSVLAPPLFISITLVGISWWLMPNDIGRWLGLVWATGTGVILIFTLLLLNFWHGCDCKMLFAKGFLRGN